MYMYCSFFCKDETKYIDKITDKGAQPNYNCCLYVLLLSLY